MTAKRVVIQIYRLKTTALEGPVLKAVSALRTIFVTTTLEHRKSLEAQRMTVFIGNLPEPSSTREIVDKWDQAGAGLGYLRHHSYLR